MANDLKAALERILEEPKNTLSDGKALKAIVRIANEALASEARASLSTSKQAGAEPVDWSKMEALGWQRINCPVCGDMARAAPGAAIAAREQEALPEPVMLSLFEGGEKTWPHYFDLKVGQRVRVHTGEEGTIACLLRRTKKYHVLFRPDYGGTYGAWEVTPLASREEAPVTPPAAIPAAPSTSSFIDTIQPWTMEHLKAYPKAALEILNKRIDEANAAPSEGVEHLWTIEQLNGIAKAVRDACGPATARQVRAILAHQRAPEVTQPTTVQQAQSEPFNPLDHEQTK